MRMPGADNSAEFGFMLLYERLPMFPGFGFKKQRGVYCARIRDLR